MMKHRITWILGLAVLLLAALLPWAVAEEAQERTSVPVDQEFTPQEWINGLDPEIPAGCYLTGDLMVPAFSVPDANAGPDYDLVIDLRGYTLTLTVPFVGPSKTDGIYIGYFNDVVIKNGTITVSGDADVASLIRDNGWDVTLEDVQLGDRVRTYNEGVLNVPWGKLTLKGNSSVLQGPDSADAIIVGQENTSPNADLIVDTTGEVNGRIKVLPLSTSRILSTVKVKNIYSTAKEATVTTPGGIRASMSFLASGEVGGSIEISGGTWSAFILDGYCERGKVCVRVKDEAGNYVYRIFDKDSNPATATNGSGELLTFRFESLQDCLDNAIYPARKPEVVLIRDTTLESPLMVNGRTEDLVLNLNGHTLTGSGEGVLVNAMTGYFLSIVDRVGGGQIGSGTDFSVQLNRDSKTYFGYRGGEEPDEETYKSFTVSGIEVGTGSTQTEVHATNAFASAHPVDGWMWVESDDSAAKKLAYVIATRTTTGGESFSYTTLKEAVSAAATGDTVTLRDDVTLNDVALQFPDNITATFDLGGYTITANPAVIYPGKNSHITVKNGEILCSGNTTVLNANAGHITLGQGLTVSGDRTLLSATNANGLITIDGAEVSTTGDTRAAMVISNYADQPASIEIRSGSLSSAGGPAVEMINSSRFILEGGSVSASGAADSIAQTTVYCRTVSPRDGANPQIAVNGGIISSTSGYAVGASGASSVTVTGGTLNGHFTVENGNTITAVDSGTFNGDVRIGCGRATITGGILYGSFTVENSNKKTDISSGTFNGDVRISCGRTTITGGEFHGNTDAIGSGSLQISGGRFRNDPDPYVAPDYKVLEPMDDDPMYRVIRDEFLTVTFDPGNGDDPASFTVDSGKQVGPPEADPEWEGHVFNGWYQVMDPATGELAENTYNFNLPVLASMTLRGRWTQVYTVTFLVSDEEEEEPRIYQQQQVVEGKCAEKPADLYQYGFRFTGWKLEDGTNYSFDSPVMGDITLYASWEEIEKYTVAFNSDGGTAVEVQTVYLGEMAFRPVNPEKENSIFEDWYLVTDGVMSKDPYDFTTPVTESITLKALWIYTITFDANGGIAVDSQRVVSGEKASRPSEGPYRNSYAFDGWYLLIDGEETDAQYDFDTPVTQSITLRARWIPVWVVFFDKNNGEPEGSVPVIDGRCLESERIPADPEREGLHFSGWYLVGEDGTEASDPFDFANMPIRKDTTLRAKWVGVYYVIFDSDGGSLVPAQPVLPDEKAVPPAIPEREGYIFAGWHLITCDKDRKEMIMQHEAYDFNTPVTGTICLKARWVDETKILTLPDGITSVESEAFSGVEAAEAVRLPGNFTGFNADAFDADLIILAPEGSDAASRAGELGFLVVEE